MPRWYYEQHYLGYNFRLNEIQAALGISQLNKINKLNKKRQNIANRYYKNLKNLNISLPVKDKYYESSNHLFVIKIESLKKNNRDLLYNKLLKNGVETNVHYIPVFLHPFFKRFKFEKAELINSYKYFKEALSIPIYPNMKLNEQIKVISIIKKTLNK